jgi:MYXO-CTERM domain-containing protein
MRAVLALILLGLSTSIAYAHVHLLEPLSRTDDPLGDPQKEQFCGQAGSTRTTRVTMFHPGDTITVKWVETIAHPGWFRIAFQPNGEVFEIPPPSNGNAVVNGTPQASNFPTENLTGMTDPTTGTMILQDRIANGNLNETRMMQVTLPNMECTNCTLQMIMVMENNPPYTNDAASNDIYFQCADLTLAKDAPDAGATGEVDAGTDPGGSNNEGSGADLGKVSGGCSVGGSAGRGTMLPIALALLGLVMRRRRRA